MEIAGRLRQIIQDNGLTSAAFADEIGVQRSSISHVLSGRNKPSLEFLQKILLRYPEVDLPWLISGHRSHNDRPAVNTMPAENDRKPVDKQVVKVVLFYNDGTFEDFGVNKK